MNRSRTETSLLMLLALVLVGLEIVAAYLAYETIGAIASVLYFMAIGINIVFLLIAIRSRLASAVGMLVLTLMLVPNQFMLAQRLWRVQSEAARVVSFAYEQKLASQYYPPDLSRYGYHDADVKTYFSYREDPSFGGFILCYYVGTETTSHCYSPENGWTYYPD